jgi:hypothetical protein
MLRDLGITVTGSQITRSTGRNIALQHSTGAGFPGFTQGGITLLNTTVYPPPVAYGNYIEIDNVTPIGGVVTISAGSDTRTWRSPLNGIEIVARSNAPKIKAQPASLGLYNGGQAQFSVAVEGAAPLSYNWRKNGATLSDGGNIYGSTTNSLTVTDLTLADTGDYDVVMTNSFGSATSVVTHLEVVLETTADTAIDAFNKAYLIQTNGLTYYASSLTNRGPDGTWTMCLDIQGEEDAYERTQSPQQRQLINSLLTTFLIQTPPPWSWDGWNDDIGWFSLALVRGYQMTGNANFLNAAEYGFNFAFTRGWDTNYNSGGIWEEQPANDSGAPGKNPLACDSLLQTVCMLYQSTSNAVYLAQAEQIYSWVRTNLFDTNTGLVYGSLSGAIIGTAGSWDNSGNTVAKVFDGNLSTFFDGPDTSGDWVGLNFGAGVSNTIGQINYWPRTGYSSRMLGGVFQGDNNLNFSNPISLFAIITAPPEGGVVTSQTVTNAQAFRYVRYVGPSNGSCNVSELQFFAPNAPSASTQITNIWDGTQLTLSWPNGGTLLEATNVAGPWTTNSSAVTPFVVLPAQPQKYFRILIQ